MKKKPARGVSPKHAGTAKHGGTRKHHPVHHKAAAKGAHGGKGAPPHSTGSPVHVVRKIGGHPKPRKLSPGDVACCSARAVGTLLGLTDDEVLALYWLTADGPDDGASIEDTLEALRLGHSSLPVRSYTITAGLPRQSRERDSNPRLQSASEWPAPAVLPASALILGLALPEGPHAVLATGDGWWSWGELYDPSGFPGAVIEEAWAVYA